MSGTAASHSTASGGFELRLPPALHAELRGAVVVLDRDGRIVRHLGRVRRDIAAGGRVRGLAHGQVYWTAATGCATSTSRATTRRGPKTPVRRAGAVTDPRGEPSGWSLGHPDGCSVCGAL